MTEDEFTALYRSLYRLHYRRVARSVGSWDEASELVHDAFAVLWSKRDSLRPGYPLEVLLAFEVQVARRDYLRKRDRRELLDEVLHPRTTDLVTHDTLPDVDLERAMASLTFLQRRAITLVYLLDHTDPESAEFFGGSKSVVKNRRRDGLVNLRIALEPGWDPGDRRPWRTAARVAA